MPLTFGADVLNEGQFAQVVCIVTQGDEPLSITWSLQGETVSSGPGLSTTTMGARTSMLTVQSVGYRHSGTYTCTAKNKAGSRSQSVDLKVNGELRLAEGADRAVTGRHFFMEMCLNPKFFNFQNLQRLSHSVLASRSSMRGSLPKSPVQSAGVTNLSS